MARFREGKILKIKIYTLRESFKGKVVNKKTLSICFIWEKNKK